MSAVTVKIQGGDKYKKFLAKMAEIAGGVKAGIFGDATTTTENGRSMHVAEYAAYNEFGATIAVTPKMRAWFHYQGIHLSKDTESIRIPARPFMRTVAKEKPKTWIGTMVKYLRGKAENPAAWKDALGLAGEQMKSDIVDSIQNGSWTPNSPATVMMKESKGKSEPDHPLMDTGHMIAAVTYQVVDKV